MSVRIQMHYYLQACPLMKLVLKFRIEILYLLMTSDFLGKTSLNLCVLVKKTTEVESDCDHITNLYV